MNNDILIPLPSGEVPVNEIPDHSISFDVADSLVLNSDQREALLPKLDDAALTKIVKERILPNIVPFLRRQTRPVTYDEALALLYAPELVRRLESR